MQAPITIKSGQPRLKCIHTYMENAAEKNSENQYICTPFEGLENAADIEKSSKRCTRIVF